MMTTYTTTHACNAQQNTGHHIARFALVLVGACAALLAVLALSPAYAHAQTVTQNSLVYDVEGSEATVVGASGEPEQVLIPSKVNGVAVKSIAQGAFSSTVSLKQATIEASLTEISMFAFMGCNNLVTVVLPPGLKTIRSSAFWGCTKLENIELPASLEEIEGGAFGDCMKLKSVTFPSKLHTLGKSAFVSCIRLEQVNFNSGLANLDDLCFSQCKALKSVTLPNSLVKVGQEAFSYCAALESAVLPTGLTTVSKGLFMSCSALKTISGYDNVEEIGDNAFSDCTALLSPPLPEKLKKIGGSAFRNCMQLKSVVFPSKVTSIGARAFQGCAGLQTVTVNEGVGHLSLSMLENCKALTSINLPHSLQSVGDSALKGCTKLSEVILSDKTNTIGENAFANMSALRKVAFPYSGSTNIVFGGAAFTGCTNGASGLTVYGTWPVGSKSALEKRVLNEEFTYRQLDKVTVNLTGGIGSTPSVSKSVFRYSSFVLRHPVDTFGLAGIGDFSKWTDVNSDKDYALGDTVAHIPTDMTFKASWNVALYNVAVSPNNNGASFSTSTNFAEGLPFTFPEVPAERTADSSGPNGYRFANWSYSGAHKDADGNASTRTAYSPGDVIYPTANGSATATWIPVRKITLIFADGATPNEEILTTTISDPIPELPVPACEGKTFKRWYRTDMSGTQTVCAGMRFNSTTYMNMSLIAEWETIHERLVAFYACGGTVDGADVAYRSTNNGGTFAPGTMPQPTREGYIFDGWCMADGTPVPDDGTHLFSTSAKLIAHWTYDPLQEMGSDGTPLGAGASEQAADKALTTFKSETDPAGSAYAGLQLKVTKTAKKSVTLAWKKVAGAKTYVLYANKCNKVNPYVKLASIKAPTLKRTVKKVVGKALTKGTYYKFIMVALDVKGNVLSTSKTVHVATKGGKVGNDGKVTTAAKRNKVTLKVGKTVSLKGKAVAASKKLKVKRHRKVAYESTNLKIATVSAKGKVKAKAKGSCIIWAYAQNGVSKKVKVTVK